MEAWEISVDKLLRDPSVPFAVKTHLTYLSSIDPIDAALYSQVTFELMDARAKAILNKGVGE